MQGFWKADIKPASDLANLLGDGRLSMANVDIVPAGTYGRAALQKLDPWPSVSSKIAQAKDVRATPMPASRGETAPGMSITRDALAGRNMAMGRLSRRRAPASSTPSRSLPVRPYLRSDRAKAALEARGFTLQNRGRC